MYIRKNVVSIVNKMEKNCLKSIVIFLTTFLKKQI